MEWGGRPHDVSTTAPQLWLADTVPKHAKLSIRGTRISVLTFNSHVES